MLREGDFHAYSSYSAFHFIFFCFAYFNEIFLFEIVVYLMSVKCFLYTLT